MSGARMPENDSFGGWSQNPARILSVSFEFRILNLLVILLCFGWLREISGFRISGEIFLVLLVWLLVCIAYFVLFGKGMIRTRKSLANAHFGYYFAGIACAAVLMRLLAGTAWVAAALLLFELVYANILMKRMRGMAVTAFAAFCYFSVRLMAHKGIFVPGFVIPGAAEVSGQGYFSGMGVVVIGAVFSFLSLETGIFSKVRSGMEEEILVAEQRTAARTERLRSMAKALKKKTDENEHVRNSARRYIEKKEREVDAIRRDLEEQIEKLRETQGSMVFMIDDLNEMSAQLREAHDRLEEKVRERTEELMHINQKLHRSEKLAFLGRLAGSVTHELRNPLGVLSNAAYCLGKKVEHLKNEDIEKYLTMLRKEITVIDQIIRDIMGFARTRMPKVEEIDIRKLINRTIAELDIPALVEVKKELMELPRVKVDPNQMRHAFLNIANNAIIAMKGNGILTFRTHGEKSGKVCIEIEDDGPGIRPEERDLIFEPLYSSKPKGTGLGLPLAKMLIESHSGKLEFTSDPGKGTTFSICLPVKREGVANNE